MCKLKAFRLILNGSQAQALLHGEHSTELWMIRLEIEEMRLEVRILHIKRLRVESKLRRQRQTIDESRWTEILRICWVEISRFQCEHTRLDNDNEARLWCFEYGMIRRHTYDRTFGDDTAEIEKSDSDWDDEHQVKLWWWIVQLEHHRFKTSEFIYVEQESVETILHILTQFKNVRWQAHYTQAVEILDIFFQDIHQNNHLRLEVCQATWLLRIDDDQQQKLFHIETKQKDCIDWHKKKAPFNRCFLLCIMILCFVYIWPNFFFCSNLIFKYRLW